MANQPKGLNTMPDFVKLATTAGDQYLAALAESQETFLKSIAASSTWVPTVPKVPTPAFLVELPAPQAVVDANFAFVTKLLKQQKDFTEKLLAQAAPTA
jgi:hypothetical protein